MKKVKVSAVSWDWKEQPNIEQINRGIQAVFTGQCPAVQEAETNSDQYGIIISSIPLTEGQVAKAWEAAEEVLYSVEGDVVFELEI